MIIGVAIKHKGVMICLPKPNRHHHCIRYGIDVLGLERPITSLSANQGFYTADGAFLNRVEAMEYVKKVGQPIINPKPLKQLFSEDLW